jgi:UDP-N-acetyl-D-mannosaminuronic acid dehydrogenase
MNSVCVLGLGYIGLPTASLVATKGFQVSGVDVNPHTVNTINAGRIHIHEPDLDILVKSAVQSGNLKAHLEPVESDIFIIAVPTPFREEFRPDLTFVREATLSLAKKIRPGNLVILESTCPVGTTEWIRTWISEARPELDMNGIYFAHCPERVLPGQILKELVLNDRIIGGLNPKASELARDFYAQFVQGEIILTDARTAELTKLTENAFRDVNIAFANELSLICEKLSINVWELIALANRHPRVKILQPGPGVGGHCIAVDPWFIVDSAPNESKLIRTAREVNDGKPKFLLEKIRTLAGKEKTIACLGLAFKANVDDLRSSPALEITEALAKEGKNLFVVEPHISELPKSLQKENVKKVDTQTAIEKADVILVLVDHAEFKKFRSSPILEKKSVIDTRGIWR